MPGLRSMNGDSDHDGARADALRQEMVDQVIAWRAQVNGRLSSEVEVALRTVPRHLFLPEVSVDRAYADDAVTTKRDMQGAVHLVSAPSVVAVMLDQLGPQRGHRVMEIGSGGYGAALLKELLGPSGGVTTIDIDPDADVLRGALTQPCVEAWSGVTLGGLEPFDDLELWLATAAPAFGILKAEQSAVDHGLVSRSLRWGVATMFDGASLAYRAARPTTSENIAHEFGAYAHGPDAARVANQFVEQIQTWDRDHRYGARPQFAAYPAGTPDDQLPKGALVINKRHTRITITWPVPEPAVGEPSARHGA